MNLINIKDIYYYNKLLPSRLNNFKIVLYFAKMSSYHHRNSYNKNGLNKGLNKGNYQLKFEEKVIIATCEALSLSLQRKFEGSIFNGIKMPLDTVGSAEEYDGHLTAPECVDCSSTTMEIALFALTKFVGGWKVLNDLCNASRPYSSMLIENIIRTEFKMPLLLKPRTAFNESV